MLDIGDELPPVTIDLSSAFIADYARELGMDVGRFTSNEGARAEGLPGQIAPGNLSLSLIARCLSDWAPGTRLARLGTTFRGLVLADQSVVVRGNIVEKHERAGQPVTLECDVWMENGEGDRLVVGTATLEVEF